MAEVKKDYPGKFGGFASITLILPHLEMAYFFGVRSDKLILDGKKHGEYFMDWAVGEKELRFYPDVVLPLLEL